VARLIDLLSAIGAGFAAAALVAVVVLLSAEILWRLLLGRSFPAAWIYSTYLLGVVLFGGAAYTLRQEGHIRVRVLERVLPPAGRRALEAAVAIVAAAMIAVLAYSLGRMALASYEGDVRSFTSDQTPLLIPQLALTIAVALLLLQLLLRVVLAATGASTSAAPETPRPIDEL
jgi:TRAP-type C4-dicarboxylate transport system permease small subunit